MRGLIVVDVQYDFLPGGALGVPEGDAVAGPIAAVRDRFDLVVFTQDWHPADHCSFKEHGGPWPAHCVQETAGARIDARILRPGDIVVRKGIHRDVDSYSGFWDNERRHRTELAGILARKGVRSLHVCGLATDYCVKATALDAREAGYDVALIADACRGVEVRPGDVARALEEMRARGVRIVTSDAVGRAP